MTSITNNVMESNDDYTPPVKLKKTTNEVCMKMKSLRNEEFIFLG